MIRRPPTSTLFTYTTLFRSRRLSLRERRRALARPGRQARERLLHERHDVAAPHVAGDGHDYIAAAGLAPAEGRSEEHTSELQSQAKIVYRLVLEKKTYAIRY